MEEFKKLSENLKTLRKDYGYTQKEIADKLGITYQSYQAYERLAEIYDVSMDFLIGKKDI